MDHTSTKLVRVFIALLVSLGCHCAMGQVSAGYCGGLTNNFGPFDYRADHHVPAPGDQMPHPEKRRLVEGAHFTPRVESLIGAQSGGQLGPPGADLDYTLRAFPNHHRALISVMRYGEKKGNPQPPGLRYVVECYFERALRFKPNDVIVRMIYSTYLTKHKREAEAVAQLEQATALAGDNAFTHYNIGLTYFDMKIYDKALARAHRATELGFDRTELRDQLRNANQWQEPKIEAKVEPETKPEPKPAQ
ncbi:MAG: hypothetical protein IPO19_00485 [Rhodoferax sp.]|nr:hypothetical protein [Rhodoferax sp.]